MGARFRVVGDAAISCACFKLHFTPTSSSWLNLVERFFADLTGDVIRAGSFASVGALVRDIKAYLAQRNADPKPFVWRAERADILVKIERARARAGPCCRSGSRYRWHLSKSSSAPWRAT
jgi:hypothetical protein